MTKEQILINAEEYAAPVVGLVLEPITVEDLVGDIKDAYVAGAMSRQKRIDLLITQYEFTLKGNDEGTVAGLRWIIRDLKAL